MDGYLGEIRLFAFSYDPQNWMSCDGQTLRIDDYQPLYAIIHNSYGGNAQQGTFQLPNLQGRVICGAGTGSGLSGWEVAHTSGTATVTCQTVPPHSHGMTGCNDAGNTAGATGTPTANAAINQLTLQDGTIEAAFAPASSTTITLPSAVLGTALGNQAGTVDSHNNLQPYLALQFCICVAGEYPPQP